MSLEFWIGQGDHLFVDARELEAAELMKALTIKQPWVHAILYEGKDIENRSWQRDFRGWLLHASAQPDRYTQLPPRTSSS